LKRQREEEGSGSGSDRKQESERTSPIEESDRTKPSHRSSLDVAENSRRSVELLSHRSNEDASYRSIDTSYRSTGDVSQTEGTSYRSNDGFSYRSNDGVSHRSLAEHNEDVSPYLPLSHAASASAAVFHDPVLDPTPFAPSRVPATGALGSFASRAPAQQQQQSLYPNIPAPNHAARIAEAQARLSAITSGAAPSAMPENRVASPQRDVSAVGFAPQLTEQDTGVASASRTSRLLDGLSPRNSSHNQTSSSVRGGGGSLSQGAAEYLSELDSFSGMSLTESDCRSILNMSSDSDHQSQKDAAL